MEIKRVAIGTESDVILSDDTDNTQTLSSGIEKTRAQQNRDNGQGWGEGEPGREDEFIAHGVE